MSETPPCGHNPQSLKDWECSICECEEEIADLTAQVEQMRAALKPFAYERLDSLEVADDTPVKLMVTVGDLRAAKEAVK
jgi:hypothetical protein